MTMTMLRDKDTTLRLVNELIKLNGFNDLLNLAELIKSCIYAITRLGIIYVSVKCKPLQEDDCQSTSLYTLMKPGGVHG